MEVFLVTILCFIFRSIIKIRYRLKVRGLENLTFKKNIVFLPNHPAEIDPLILVTLLWKKYRVRPVVIESFYFLRGAHYLQKLIKAIPIPDLSGIINSWKEKKIKKTFVTVCENLKQGHNLLIYPSGRLKETGKEIVGGTSFVHNLIQNTPDAHIVLIRTTGLWGSRFSKALTGKTPDFKKVVWEGIGIMIKNFIFFTPRRKVTIEIEPAASDFPRHANRLEFNHYLEAWYNRQGPEPLRLVPDFFWKKEKLFLPKTTLPKQRLEKRNGENFFKISPEIEKEILTEIGRLANKSDITRSQHLAYDIGLDSLDIGELQTFLKDRYDVDDLAPLSFQTVEDVLRAVTVKTSPTDLHLYISQEKWFSELLRPPIVPPSGKTIQEAFLKNCDRMGRHIACADEILGIVQYERLKTAALVLSFQIRRLEGDRIGILLPSSTTTYLLIFATLLANKVPVMLNWTTGVRDLNHAVNISEVKIVISSERFLDNLSSVDLGRVDEMLVVVEGMKRAISLWDKLRGWYGATIQRSRSLLRQLKLNEISEERPAVILFTSGTEALPKGVPLSHKNLLSNQTAALSCVDFSARDILYGVLPPFHSFGFSVTGIFPFLVGLKSYYAPDPKNSRKIAFDIKNWRPTLFFSAPTFIKGLLRVSSSEELKSLRYLVSGAEKAPEEMFLELEKMGIEMLEGYGITECSPIVTLTRPGPPNQPHLNHRHRGVGEPLPGVNLLIIDPETKAILPIGEKGEICINGPNVFLGYLGKLKSPFIELQGRHWYRSGDQGYLDQSGTLTLSGRLKRFVKIGGR